MISIQTTVRNEWNKKCSQFKKQQAQSLFSNNLGSKIFADKKPALLRNYVTRLFVESVQRSYLEKLNSK